MPDEMQELLQKDTDNANELYTKIKEFSEFINKEFRIFTKEHLLKAKKRIDEFKLLLKRDIKENSSFLLPNNKGITPETKGKLKNIRDILDVVDDKLDQISQETFKFEFNIDQHAFKRDTLSKSLYESAKKVKQDILQLQDQLNKKVIELELALQDKKTLKEEKSAEVNKKIAFFNRKIMELQLENGDKMYELRSELNNKNNLLNAANNDLASANNDKKTLKDNLDAAKKDQDKLRLKMRALKIAEEEWQESIQSKGELITQRQELREALRKNKQALDEKTDKLAKSTLDLENALKEIEKLKKQNLDLQASNVQLTAASEVHIKEKNRLLILEKDLTEEQILFQRRKAALEEAYTKSMHTLQEKEQENNRQLQQININLLDLTQQLNDLNKQQQQLFLDKQEWIRKLGHSEDERRILAKKEQDLDALGKLLDARKFQLQDDIKKLRDKENKVKHRSKFLQEQLSNLIATEGIEKHLMEIEEYELEISRLETAKGKVNDATKKDIEWRKEFKIQAIQSSRDLRPLAVEHYRRQHAWLDPMLKEARKDLQTINNNDDAIKLTQLIDALEESSSKLALLLNSKQPNSKLIHSLVEEWQKGKKTLSAEEKEYRKSNDTTVTSILVKLQQCYNNKISLPQIADDGSYYCMEGLVFVSLGKLDDFEAELPQAKPPLENQLYYPYGNPIHQRLTNTKGSEGIQDKAINDFSLKQRI